MSPRATSTRAGLVLLALGCGASFDGSSEPAAIAAAPRRVAGIEDTVRVTCGPSRVLRPGRVIPTPERVRRLVELGGGILAVLDSGGVGRVDRGAYEAVRPDGRDIAVRGSELFVLVDDRIEVVRMDAGRRLVSRTLAAETRDVSIAVAGGALYVHSPYYEAALLVRRRISGGRAEARLLPVERDLALALLTDLEGLSEDTAILRGDDRRLAVVPWVRDPVAILDASSGRWTFLELAGGERGRVRIDETESRDEQSCSTCTRRVRREGRRVVRRLYGGAHVDGEAMWLVRLSPPGSHRGVLHRVGWGGELSSIRSWRLAGLGSSPGAVIRHEDEIWVAGENAVYVYARPSEPDGTPCEASDG